MKEKLESLISLLKQQYKIYDNLYYLLDEEYDNLVNGKTEEIRRISDLKSLMVEKVDHLEYQRVMLCEEIARELGVEGEATISRIAPHLEEEDAKALLTWRGTFETLLINLKDKNDTNNMMANSALQNVESTIEAVKESLQTTDVYQKRGSKKNGEQIEHLFSKKA